MKLLETIHQSLRGPYGESDPTGVATAHSLEYWRRRILDVIYRSVAILGAVAYIPSVYLSVAEKIWWLAIFNTVGYAWFIWAAFSRRSSFAIQAGILLAFIYILGVALLIQLGPFAAGPIWLFAFPVMTSLLFGLRPAVGALVVNAITVVCFGAALMSGHLAIAFMPPNMAIKWWVISANFLLLDTVVTLSIAALLRGLKAALDNQRQTSRSLEEKHRELQNANEDLRLEFAERQRAEAEIKRSHEILVTVLDSIDADVVVADLETHEVLLMNRHMRESFGGDCTGSKCWQSFQNRDTPCESCYSAAIVDDDGQATGLKVWEGENPVTGRRYLNFDRAIHWIDKRLVRLQIAMDITDLTRIQEEKLQLETQLRQAQKMEAIGTLAGGIAHDFNNILAAILGYSEIMLDDCRGQQPMEGYLGEILKAAHRAKDLTQQILTFSRQAEVAPKPVRVSSLVREAVKLLRASIPATISIREELHSDATVLADPTQLHQVVMNLATNAAHAMETKGGILTIALDEVPRSLNPDPANPMNDAGPFLQLTVADTGQGIDESLQERIFDPYFTTKGKGKGTGMGLSVVHGIVKNCGGDIQVESAAGQGAIFRIYLPAQEVPGVTTEPDDRASPAGGNQETILVVDDEPQIAHVLQLMLESLGYRVVAYTSSQEALQRFEKTPHSFDLIITDMTMPNLTGEELSQAVLRRAPDMPIVLCTGFNENINEERARQLGIRRFIYKPIVRNTLADIVKQALKA
ncbi:MAG: response regulator [Desulfobacterales bacterium]|jgi:signal transduction histidine kinase